MAEIDVADDDVAELSAQLAGTTELVLCGAQPYREPWYQTVEPWCAALGRIGSATLERLVVDTYFQPLTRQASVYCGDITSVFRACPNLSFAYVIGCAGVEAFAHDRIEDLTLMGEPMTPATISAVAGGRAPKLTKLALGFSYEHGAAEGADAALIDALARDGLPALEELHIGYPENPLALLGALARLPLPRLRVLSIAGSAFDDEEAGLAMLREHAQRLGTLEALHLAIEDIMEYDDARLAEMFPTLRGIDEIEPFSPNRYRA